MESRGIVLSVYKKTKALISCAVTAQLICTFFFAYRYAKIRFSRDAALILQFLIAQTAWYSFCLADSVFMCGNIFLWRNSFCTYSLPLERGRGEGVHNRGGGGGSTSGTKRVVPKSYEQRI